MKTVRIVSLAGILLVCAVIGMVLHAKSPAPGSPDTAAPGTIDPTARPALAGGPRSGLGVAGKAPANETFPPPPEGAALLGSVVAPVQSTLSVRMPMRIAQVRVREGDTVRAGQPVIDFDDSDFTGQARTARAGIAAALAQVDKATAGKNAQQVKADADVSAARTGLKTAQARSQQALLSSHAAEDDQAAEVKTAQEGVRKAQIGLDRAKETLRGLEELSKVGGVSRSDLEGARTQVSLAQSDLETAQAGVRRLQAGANGIPYRVALARKDADAAQAGVQQAHEGIRSAEAGRKQALAVAEQDIRSARATLTQAQAGLTSTESSRTQAHLTAPLTGLVSSLGARTGETAQPGTPLLTIIKLVDLRIEALVPARLLASLHPGQPATVTVDTAPGRKFAALVSDISRIAEADGRTFRVKFRLLGAPLLRPGQSARIRLSLR